MNGLADRKVREPLENLAEYHRKIVRCKWLISRSIADVVEKLCQRFPEDLAVDGSENTEKTSTRQKVKQREGTSNFELPWRKEERAVSMLDF